MTVSRQAILDSQTLIIDEFKRLRPQLLAAYGTIVHETKDDASPVTELDVAVEVSLKEKLLAAFPSFGFKGEETPAVASTSGATWYVDPIDGTSSFIHGLPYCANMAGLVVDGEIVASVIYHFVTDDLYTAVKGEGAYRNGEPIHVREMALRDSYVFAGAFPYRHVHGHYEAEGVHFVAPIGASGYFFTRLAQGSIQGVCYLNGNSKAHDIIPGALLVAEAGGEVVPFRDKPFDYTCLNFMMGTASICDIARKHQEEITKLLILAN